MSEFSGKCDLWDSLVMIRESNDETTDWSKIKIYQHTDESYFDEKGFHGDQLLDIKCLKDLLPYAAFLTSMAYGNQDGTYICHIGKRSFIDTEEEERFTWYLKDIQKLYRRCKRKKIEFTEEYVMDKMHWWSDKDAIKTLFYRVKEHPYSANVKGLHDDMHQYYRKRLEEDMIKAGYTSEQAHEWVYHNNKTW